MGRDLGRLPIHDVEERFIGLLGAGEPVVVSAPTGSGKSTVVPVWCARETGRALVVEPRRVACRSLARYVARTMGVELGREVGYVVRHDEQAGPDTRILFVTPGIALRMIETRDHRAFPTVVIDEFHERSLEMDLLLALLHRDVEHLVVMSATMDGDRIARFLGGTHLQAEGRLHPVEIDYAGEPLLPTDRDLDRRVADAVRQVWDRRGDILVFLPGKAEISACASRLMGMRGLEVIPLHAQLPPREQDRAFDPGPARRVVLATNVAETSVTIPRIGVVIDSGLVRQTRYRGTRGYLTLVPVAMDSADQRAGRAGRLFPGYCLRLWSRAANLEATTPPEIHREALPVVVLAAAACGSRASELRFLDPPKPYALDAAERALVRMGALDRDRAITPMGRRLFSLPLDANLGRILLEAEADPRVMQDVVDLVAAVACGRPLFRPGPRPADPKDDLRHQGCDATAFIMALRMGDPERHRLNPGALAEARRIARQLRRIFRLPRPDPGLGVDRNRLARVILAAHPDAAYIPRRRKKYLAWANGREELELGRDTAIQEDAEAIVVVDTRAITVKKRKTVQVVTCAIPVTHGLLEAAGLGEVRVGKVKLEHGRLVVEAIRSYAGLVLERKELTPTGELVRQAVVKLLLEGRLFPEAMEVTRDRIAAHNLFHKLDKTGAERVELERWIAGRVEELGLESPDDLELVMPEDFLFPDLEPDQRAWLDKNFPREVSVGDAVYQVQYDEVHMEATLVKIKGNRKGLPSLAYLPPWPGWRLLHKDRAVVRVLRERR